ncbi:MAG: ester cyclase [Edaphobacter sp.]
MEHWSMPPGFASPYHTHHREDEAFYILEGEMAFVCDGKWQRGGPGTWVFGPRELPHGFKVVGTTPARMLLLCSPAGFEHFVLELGVPFDDFTPPDMAKLMETAAKYHIDIHGPLPEEPANNTSPNQLPTDLKGLNHRWIDAFNQQDWATERAVRGPNFQAYLSGTPEPLNNEAWSQFMLHFTSAFPDAHISAEACIAEGDTVVSRWVLTGTHKGVFQGIPPTGRAVRFNGIEFNRVIDRQFVEHWSQFDLASLLQQIGSMPV